MGLQLLAELKRRRVFRALIGCGIASFAVLQIIEPVMHGFHWPDAVLSYVVAALPRSRSERPTPGSATAIAPSSGWPAPSSSGTQGCTP